MRTGQACGLGPQGQGIPGCGSGPLQRWDFARCELRQALPGWRHRKGTTARNGARAEGREQR